MRLSWSLLLLLLLIGMNGSESFWFTPTACTSKNRMRFRMGGSGFGKASSQNKAGAKGFGGKKLSFIDQKAERILVESGGVLSLAQNRYFQDRICGLRESNPKLYSQLEQSLHSYPLTDPNSLRSVVAPQIIPAVVHEKLV